MRNLSSDAIRAIYAPETNEAFFVLITLTHVDLAEANPLRFVNNTKEIVSRGFTFLPYAFDFTLPDEREDQVPNVNLRIDNVDRAIVRGLRMLTTRPQLTMEVVLSSTPSVVEAGPFDMELKSVEYDALTITGELGFEPVLVEPFPGRFFTPNNFRGLF